MNELIETSQRFARLARGVERIEDEIGGLKTSLLIAKSEIERVIDSIDKHFSGVELATNETLIGGWRKALAAAIEKL